MRSVVKMHAVNRRARPPRWRFNALFQRLRTAWQHIIATVIASFPPDSPQPTPPLSKAAALREGAILSEHVDARSKSRVA
jgi:hypothetical protein